MKVDDRKDAEYIAEGRATNFPKVTKIGIIISFILVIPAFAVYIAMEPNPFGDIRPLQRGDIIALCIGFVGVTIFFVSMFKGVQNRQREVDKFMAYYDEHGELPPRKR